MDRFEKRVYQQKESVAAGEEEEKNQKTVSKLECVAFSFDGVWKCLQKDLQLLEKLFLCEEYIVNENPVKCAREWL